jgi:hypothetical protein
MFRLPLFSRLAAHVFFGRGSFPDVMDHWQPELGNSPNGHARLVDYQSHYLPDVHQ